MQRNAEILRAVGDRIAAHPHLYDQGEWGKLADCGTLACVAGHAVDLAGYTVECVEFAGAAARDSRGDLHSTSALARGVLGLDADEAGLLFAGGWRPAGWHPDDDDAHTANLVRDALYALADGAAVEAVTEPEDEPAPTP